MRTPEKPCASIDVLIAEDDPVTRLAVRQMLESQGYTCAEAENGREAVEIARQSAPRLVLLDLMMPEVDGFTAAEQLRADPQMRGVSIHCLTALDFPAARRAAQRSGCEVYITKPFDVDGLLDVVSVALNSGPGSSKTAGG
jgi:CheY-like chemotaxis protein